ncbi:MAG: caspase family protein, partial [Beijerinckiaceae bacterium]
MTGMVRKILAGLIAGTAFLALSTVAQTQSPPPAPPQAAQDDQPDAQQNSKATQVRFAFVVGVEGYEAKPLPTASADASLVAAALKGAGFEVVGARNLDQDTFRASYREFLQKVTAAGPGAVTAIYIAGYGLQLEGENYFVPDEATVDQPADIPLNAIRLSDLLRPLASLPGKTNIVMLDLAYDGPFAKGGDPIAPGLALMQPDPGMLISINASPGVWAPENKAPYGNYAKALAEAIREGGLPLNDLFDKVRLRVSELSKGAQVPWNASRIEQPFMFVERKPDAPALTMTPQKLEAMRTQPIAQMSPEDAYSAALGRDTFEAYQEFLQKYPDSKFSKNVAGILAARREALTWQETVATNSKEAYWSYLDRYPKGPHAADARRRLNRLSAAARPPQTFKKHVYRAPPPPPREQAFYDDPQPQYVAPIEDGWQSAYSPPAPAWTPPPPPEIDEDEDYFLPAPEADIIPAWSAPPDYVEPPPPPVYVDGPPRGINPYIAIPAAVATGIIAGKLIGGLRNRNGGPGNRVSIFPGIAQPPRVVPFGGRNNGRRPVFDPARRQQLLQQRQQMLQQRQQLQQQLRQNIVARRNLPQNVRQQQLQLLQRQRQLRQQQQQMFQQQRKMQQGNLSSQQQMQQRQQFLQQQQRIRQQRQQLLDQRRNLLSSQQNIKQQQQMIQQQQQRRLQQQRQFLQQQQQLRGQQQLQQQQNLQRQRSQQQ